MAKKASKKSSKKSKAKKKSSRKKTASKRSAAKKTAPKTAPETVLQDEHTVLAHLMWILFLFSAGLAAVFTVQFLLQQATAPEYYGVAALVLLGWAFVFKVFAHRVHPPHN